MFQAGPGRPLRLSSELPKFTLYIQEGSVFLKVVKSLVRAGEGVVCGTTEPVFPKLPLSSFFFPWGAESQAWCSSQRAGQAGLPAAAAGKLKVEGRLKTQICQIAHIASELGWLIGTHTHLQSEVCPGLECRLSLERGVSKGSPPGSLL